MEISANLYVQQIVEIMYAKCRLACAFPVDLDTLDLHVTFLAQATVKITPAICRLGHALHVISDFLEINVIIHVP
mgnify:CR=1 FL=1